MPQNLAPEFPPRGPAPPVHGGPPPARGPEFLRHGLARPAYAPEFLRRGVEFQRLDPEVLRLEAGRGQHRGLREVEGGTKLPLKLPAGLERRDPLRRQASLQGEADRFFDNSDDFRRGQTARWPRLSF